MILRTLSHTRRLAAQLAQELPPGSLLLLDGPMGTGKTTLIGLLAQELGSVAAVSSPTYTLIHEYPSPAGTLVHIDAWRLPDAAALLEMGLADYLDSARLVAVEWGGPLRELFPEATLLRLEHMPDGTRRATLVP